MPNKIIKNGRTIAQAAPDSYIDIRHKPKINSVQLVGNITSDELDMYKKEEVDNLIGSSRNVIVSDTIPEFPVKNTLYYVGIAPPYHVYLYDSDLKIADLGTSSLDISRYQTKTDGNLQTLSKNIVGAINELNENLIIPEPPEYAGTFNLQCTVDASGSVTYNWVEV